MCFCCGACCSRCSYLQLVASQAPRRIQAAQPMGVAASPPPAPLRSGTCRRRCDENAHWLLSGGANWVELQVSSQNHRAHRADPCRSGEGKIARALADQRVAPQPSPARGFRRRVPLSCASMCHLHPVWVPLPQGQQGSGRCLTSAGLSASWHYLGLAAAAFTGAGRQWRTSMLPNAFRAPLALQLHANRGSLLHPGLRSNVRAEIRAETRTRRKRPHFSEGAPRPRGQSPKREGVHR